MEQFDYEEFDRQTKAEKIRRLLTREQYRLKLDRLRELFSKAMTGKKSDRITDFEIMQAIALIHEIGSDIDEPLGTHRSNRDVRC